ncbi:MAG: hypothetical protein IKC49_01735 [Clostridia bacterium]|nr:hypothetical protein [Clostridia bacterium]
MKLSQENIKALHDCAENKQRLVVSGKNALGQKFTTEGIILPGITHDGQPKWVSECGFGLFVGQTKKNSLGETVKLFVPLYSYAKNDEYDCDTLYIQNVVSKADGTIVYTNPDFDAIITTSLAVQEAKPHTAKWFNIPLNEYAQKLTTLIGKPVIYVSGRDNERVVIKNVHMINCSACADTTDGYLYRGLPHLTEGEIKLDKKAYETLEKYGATSTLEDEDIVEQ